jgi:hypothetical protein
MAISSTPIKRKQNLDIAGSLLTQGDATFQQAVTLGMDPVEAMQAATKQYVDAVQQGLDLKESVRVATTQAIDIDAAPMSIDGVALNVGDRVLVKEGAFSSAAAETDVDASGARNGIYVVDALVDTDADTTDDALALVRAQDADGTPEHEVNPGMFMFVEEGITNLNTGFVLATNGAIEVGVTELNFTAFSRSAELLAGLGLVKDGNTFNVAEGGITDAMLGNRVIDDTVLPTDTAELAGLLSGLAHEIKAIKGADDWKAPAVALGAPEAVSAVTATEAVDSADVTVGFTLPTNRDNVSKYEIWRAYGAGTFELVGLLEDEEIDGAATEAEFVDGDLEKMGLINYKVYAVNNGIRSEAVAGSVTTANEVTDPANLQVVATSDYYDIRFDLPKDERLEEVVVKVDKNADELALDEANATEIYRGTSDNLTYVIPEADMDKFHQFYVNAVTALV